MAIYVQLADRLLKVSNDVTVQNITEALGYVPFNGEFSELKNSPFYEDNSGEYNVVDEAGNIILKINQDGVKTTKVLLPKGDVQEQIDSLGSGDEDLRARCDELQAEIESLGVEVENIDFASLKNNPITITDGEFIIMDDQNPSNIGLKLDTNGLFVRDVYIDGNSIKDRLSDIDNTFLNVSDEITVIQGNIENLGTDIEDLDDKLDNFKFADLNDNPIDISGNEFIIMDDEKPVGNVGLRLNSTGLFVKDVIINGSSVQGEISDLHAEDNVLANEIEDVAAEVNRMKNNFTTNNLTVNTQSNLKGSTNISGVATIEGETTFSGTTTIYGTTTIEDITTDSITTNDAELKFVDEEGYTVAKIDETGVSAFEFNIVSNNEVTHKLSEKANQSDLETAVTELTTIIEDNELVWAEAFNVHEERLTAAESDIDNLENVKADKETVNTQINTLTQSLEDHTKVKATTSTLGHVTLNSGDSSTNSYVDGVAAASKHYHSQYVENSGDTINGNLTVTGTVEMGDMVLRKDEYTFADASGNVITRIDDAGVTATEFTAGDHKLTLKANQGDFENHYNTLADANTLAHVKLQSGDFKDIKTTEAGVAASPNHTHGQYLLNTTDTFDGNLTVTGTVEMGDMVLRKDEFVFTDEFGNAIARIDDAGVESTEFTAGEHKLTLKADQSDLESHEVTEATKEVLAHVKLQDGDFENVKTTETGVAASPNHTHGQYSLSGHTHGTITLSGDVTGSAKIGSGTTAVDIEVTVLTDSHEHTDYLYNNQDDIFDGNLQVTKNLTVDGTVEMGDMVLRKDEFVFTDESGNAIARIDDAGVASTEFTAGDHKLTLKADKATVDSQISGMTANFEDHVQTKADANTLAHVKLQSGDFKDIKTTEAGVAASPNHTHGQYLLNTTDTFDGNLTVTGTVEMGDMVLRKDEFVFTDEFGNAIARIDDAGVESTEFTAGEHKLTLKADQSDLESNYAEISSIIEENEKTTAKALTSHQERLTTAEADIDNLETVKADKATVTAQINTLTQSLEDHAKVKATASDLGHVTLNSGDSSTNSFTNGVAAASKHYHSQYVENSGDTINGNLTVTGTLDTNDLALNKTEFTFADPSGNTIAKINKDGFIDAVDYVVKGGEHKLTEKADQQDLEDAIATINTTISNNTSGLNNTINTLAGRVTTAETNITNLSNNKADNATVTTLSNNVADHKAASATTSTLGHVKLKEGELSGVTGTTTGVAASSYHTHGQYLPTAGGTVTGNLTVNGTLDTNDLALNKNEYIFADPSGNIVAKINKDGFTEAVDFITKDSVHKLSEKVDASYVENAILDKLAANDAMLFKGTISKEGDFPKTFQAGYTYKVSTAGTYYGQKVEVGDMVIAVKDGNNITTSSSGFTTYWTIIQANTDGHVTGPTSATNERIAVFDGTTGKLIKDGGSKISDLATASHNHGKLKLAGDATGEVTISSGTSDMTLTVAVADDSHSHSDYLPKSGGTVTGNLTVNGTLDTNDLALNKTEFTFADPSGNTVAKINASGLVEVTDVQTKSYGKLSDKASQSDLTTLNNTVTAHTATSATTGVTGHVKLKEGDLSGVTGTTTGVAASSYHTHGQYAPKNHASTATTYGSGTTVNYGHVKINSGDCSTNTFTNGVAAASKHSHSAYATSGHTHGTITLSGDVTGSASIGSGTTAINITTTVANDSHTHSDYLLKSGGTVTGNLTVNGTLDTNDLALNKSVYVFADPSGNTIAKINASGFTEAVDFITKSGKKLSECLTQTDIANLGGGDVNGPSSATNERIAVFDGTTGKLIKDGGSKISDLAIKNHASTATTYGSGTTTNYGHVKLQAGDFSSITATTNGVAASPNHTHGQYATTDTVNGKAPTSHASTATTYGSGTTTNYGHVKINSGDCSTNTFTNGVAAASYHTHSKIEVTASATTTYYLVGQSGTSTATNTLYKNSGVYVSGGTKVCATDGFYQTSDANLKDFYGEIPVDFEKLKQIPKVYYSWKSDDNKTMYIGTSAQEVQKVYPELVATNTETGELSVDYPKLSMVGLKAVDVLYEENQMLKQEINTLKDELKLIKEKIGL